MDMTKMDRIKVDDLQAAARGLRRRGCERRAKLRDIDQRPDAGDRQGRRRSTTSTSTTTRALSLVISGRAREAFDLDRKKPTRSATRYGRNTFGQSCLLARRLVEAGTRVVEVIWPKVANSRQPLVGPSRRPDQADEEPVRPDARHRPVGA